MRGKYVVPISIVVRKRVTSLRSNLKTPFSDSFSANSRTLYIFINNDQTSKFKLQPDKLFIGN